MRLAPLLLIASAVFRAASGQPLNTGEISNAAIPGGVAPGALFQIALFSGIPGAVSDTSVTFTVGSVTRRANLLHVSTALVAGIVPADLPPGDGTFTITANG